MKKRNPEEIIKTIMSSVKPHQGLWDDPFHILITTILSTRTKDEVTDRASLRLFCKYPDIESLSKSPVSKIAELIKGVGFYRQKALMLKEASSIILKKFHGIVPADREQLMQLPGVGPKVANIVLTFGYGLEFIAVDTHVHRIFNRIGLIKASTPEQSEIQLMKKIPREYWKLINSYGVEFGKNICKPIKPRCDICRLKEVCKYYEVHH